MPAIRQNRTDLTDWISHFVHDLDPVNKPVVTALDLSFIPDVELLREYERLGALASKGDDFPELNAAIERSMNGVATTEDNELIDEVQNLEDSFMGLGVGHHFFSLWESFERDSPLPPSAKAFDVLLRVIETGYIRAGWSFRNGAPTVYGPRAACCFTEMPLHALVRYAKARGELVSPYAIAVPRNEFFEAGGRNAIYGLSSSYTEDQSAVISGRWPRHLALNCGIGLNEQYRYVHTALRRVDWMHEREWRWPFSGSKNGPPGLNLWLTEVPAPFSKIMVVVQTRNEAQQVLDLVKQLHDFEFHDVGGWQFETQIMRQIIVVSHEEISDVVSNAEIESITIEKIPKHSLRVFSAPASDPVIEQKIGSVVTEACAAAQKASAEYKKSIQATGEPMFRHGFAAVHCRSGQSVFLASFRKFAKKNKGFHVENIGSDGYQLWGFVPKTVGITVDEAELAAKAAMDVLQAYFSDIDFYVWTKLD